MITDTDNVPPVPPKEDASDKLLPVRRRSRARNREHEGIVITNSPRRSERSDAMARTEQQSTMLDGLQMKSQRLVTLSNMAQRSSERQTRWGETASDIAGSIKTVLTKMDTVQKNEAAPWRNVNKLC